MACENLPARLVSQALHASGIANQNLGFALGDHAPGANFNLVLIFEIVYNLFNQAAVLWRVEFAKKVFTFCFGDYACAPTALPRLAKGSNMLQELNLALPGLAKGQNALHKLPLAAKENLGFALGDYAPGANFNLVLIFEIVYNLFNQAAVLWRVEFAKKVFTFCFGDYACAPTALPRLAKGSNMLQELNLALPGLAKGQNALHKFPLAAKENLKFAAVLAPNVDLGLLGPSGNYNLAVKWPLWLQIWTWAFWSLLAITLWLWNGHFGSKFGPRPFGAYWQLQFGCEMAILAPNVDLGLLEPSGNYNLAMKWPFWLQMWT